MSMVCKQAYLRIACSVLVQVDVVACKGFWAGQSGLEGSSLPITPHPSHYPLHYLQQHRCCYVEVMLYDAMMPYPGQLLM